MHRRTIFRSELLSDKYDYVLNYMKRLAGGENVGFNNSVFLSGKSITSSNNWVQNGKGGSSLF